MARSRIRSKGRKQSGSFTLLPHAVQDSKNWHQCNGTAIRVLIGLARQYCGNNNGDLAPALLKSKPASEALTKALRVLCHYGLLQMTRQGRLGIPSLYALTWQPIDHCGGKLDCSATTTAPGTWSEAAPRFNLAMKQKKSSSKIKVAHFENRSDST